MSLSNESNDEALAIWSSYAAAVKLGHKILDVCAVATVTELNLVTAVTTIDGRRLENGQRILVKDQSNSTENGVYIYDDTGSSRMIRLQVTSEDLPGVLSIEGGLRNAGKLFRLSFSAQSVMIVTPYDAKTIATSISSPQPTFVTNGPSGDTAAIFPGSLVSAGAMIVSGSTNLNELFVHGALTFGSSSDIPLGEAEDVPRLNVKNGTINNCQEGGLILKVCTLAQNNKKGTSNRNVLTTVTRALAYNKVTWTQTFDSDVFVTFTGYIRPRYVESALLYLTVAGAAQLWIDGNTVINTDQTGERSTLTVPYAFTSASYVPFVLHYTSTSKIDSALVLEWSFASAPVRTIVDSQFYAYSGNEASPTVLGPVDAYGSGVFHNSVHFEQDTITDGNIIAKGSLECAAIKSNKGLGSFEFVDNDNDDNHYAQITGAGLHLMATKSTPNPALYISAAADTGTGTGGNSGRFGLEDDGTVILATENDSTSPPPLTFRIGNAPVSTMSKESVTTTVPLIAESGVQITSGNLVVVAGDIITSGQIHQSRVSIGAQQGSVYPEKLALVGENGSLTTGPQLATYTSLDTRPLFQLSSFSHDNVSLNFDASYDGSVLTPSSAYAAQICKTARQLAINHYRPNSDSWTPAWSLDLEDGTSLFSGKSIVFSGDDALGNGSVRLAPQTAGGDTSIAFYNTTNMRAALTNDFFRMGYIDSKFRIKNGTNENLVQISSEGDVTISGGLATNGRTQFNDDVRVNGRLNVAQKCNFDSLVISPISPISPSLDEKVAAAVALEVKGSGVVANNLSVGGRLLAGRLHISSALPRLIFDAPIASNTVGKPKLGETSRGTKILLAKARVSTETDIAIGTSPGSSLWHAVSGPQSDYQWYAGEHLVMSLSGKGDLVVDGQKEHGSAKVAFRNIAALSVSDQSANGRLNIGDHWSIRGSQDTFLLTEMGTGASSDTDLESPVIEVRRDSMTGNMSVTLPAVQTFQIDHGLIIAKEAAFIGQISAANVYVSDDAENGDGQVQFSDRFRLTSKQDLTEIWSVKELAIGSATGTFINRNQPAPFAVYYGNKSVLCIDDTGTTMGTGITVEKGGINVVEGALTVDDVTAVSKFSGQVDIYNQLTLKGERAGLVFSANDDHLATLGYVNTRGKGKGGHDVFVLRTPGDLNMRSTSGIRLDPGKGDVRVGGTLRIKNVALTEKGLLLKSSQDGASPSTYSLETIIANKSWYYIGELNTTPNATGPDEQGNMHLTLSDSTSEMIAWVTIERGDLVVSHSIVTPNNSEKFATRLVFYRGNSALHVFVNAGPYDVSLKIKASMMARSPVCVDEGNETEPNGQSSLYNTTYTAVWDSDNNPLSNVNASYGQATFDNKLTSNGSLVVLGRSHLQGGLQTTSLYPERESELLKIYGLEQEDADTSSNLGYPTFSTYLTIGQGYITCGKSLTPEVGVAGVDIGSLATPFRNGSFAGTLSAGDRLEAPELIISRAAKITGSVKINGSLSVLDAASEFLEISIVGGLKIDGALTASGGITTKALVCETLQVDDILDVPGTLCFSGAESIIKATNEKNTLQVQAEDVYLQYSKTGAALRLAADGTIRASGDLTLSCGSGDNINIGNEACKSICISGDVLRIDGGINSKGSLTIEDRLNVTGESKFCGKVRIVVPDTGITSLTLGSSISGLGEISVGSRHTDESDEDEREYPLLKWTQDESLTIHVPGRPHTALTLEANGDLLCVGDFRCTAGSGTFSSILTEHIACDDLCVADSVLIGKRFGLSLDENNDFNLVKHEHGSGSNASALLSIAYKSACATFAGDLVTRGSATVPSLRVGTALNITNDGRVSFAHAATNNSAEVYLTAKTGARPSAFTFSNSGGDLVFEAAKKRGFSIAAVSGNATFQGQLAINSGLDVDTSSTSDVPTAALVVKGGVLVKRSVLIEGSLQLSNEANARFSIAAPRGGRAEGGYTLRLPHTLPTGPGQFLVSNAKGQLSWKSINGDNMNTGRETTDTTPSDTLLTAANVSPGKTYRDNSYSAGNGVTDDIVNGFRATGRSIHIGHFIVTITTSANRRVSSKMVAAYDIRGLRVGDEWRASIRKTIGDEPIPITFELLSDGRLSYTAKSIEHWQSTTFTWPAATTDVNHNESHYRTLLASDTVISTPDENYGSFLSLKSSVCTRSTAEAGSDHWSGTHFGETQLVDTTPSKVGATASAATVTIADAPTWNASGERYALHVVNGVSRFGGRVVAEGGLATTSLGVNGAVNVKGPLTIGGGTDLQTLHKGMLHVGPSSNKTVTLDISFTAPMSDTAYCMLGNAVSADPDSPDAFACTFKNLTRAGCRVTVCNITGDAWSDVTLRVHWFAVL